MSAPDRDKLRAGLSGLLSGAPPAEEAVAPAPTPDEKAPPKPAARPKRRKTTAPPTAAPASAEPPAEEGEHVRTTTGYVKADGERVHRVSIMLTKAERRRLRDLAEDEGVTITDLVRRTLDL